MFLYDILAERYCILHMRNMNATRFGARRPKDRLEVVRHSASSKLFFLGAVFFMVTDIKRRVSDNIFFNKSRCFAHRHSTHAYFAESSSQVSCVSVIPHIEHSMSHAPSLLFPSHLSTTSLSTLSTCTPIRRSARSYWFRAGTAPGREMALDSGSRASWAILIEEGFDTYSNVSDLTTKHHDQERPKVFTGTQSRRPMKARQPR